MQTNPFIENLKREANANPMVALGIAAALSTGLSKLLDASTNRLNAKTHAKEVERRVRKQNLS